MPGKDITADFFAPPEGEEIEAGGFGDAPPPDYVPAAPEPIDLEPKASADLVARYTCAATALGIHPKVVYHPCSGINISPSASFPDSRVIYVEIDPHAVAALKQKGYEAHETSATEFKTEVPVDLLILLNPTIPSEGPAANLRSGGYVFTNNYHGNANELKSNPNYELVGVVVPGEEGLHLDQENLDEYWQTVETEEEFKKARDIWGAVHYDTARSTVRLLSPDAADVLVAYKGLLEQARAEFRSRATQETAALLGDTELLLLKGPNGMPLALEPKLPHKKGTVDDIFVFRKK